MKKMKVLTIVGTRPEIIKLSRVIHELDEHTEHILVHSGQNYDYELNEIFFQSLEIRRPNHFLNAAGNTVAQTIGNVIAKADEVFAATQPDAILLLGDTNSCLAAYPAKRRKIPIFHMEAGNRCFDQRVPEEINRKMIDHLSDINLSYTEHARRYLLNEGLKPEMIIKTGSPMNEVLAHYRPQMDMSNILKELNLERERYFVVSAHREENIDNEIKSVQSEYKRLKNSIFKHRRTGLLHGKLKADEKNSVMEDFTKGLIDILISTTVVEVGVDVPNATVILIEDADRFGLSQLHQLRGRVGRSSYQSYCYLVTSTSAKPSARLRAIEKSNDGFYLAEVDLKLRGPGEIYGKAQHGALNLQVATLADTKMTHRVKKSVDQFIKSGDNLLKYPQLAKQVKYYQRLTTLN